MSEIETAMVGVDVQPARALAPHRPLIPLAEPAERFASLCRRIDDNSALEQPRPISDLVKVEFKALQTDLALSVEEHIACKHAMEDFVAGCKKREEAMRARRKQMEEALATFKGDVRDVMQQHRDQPYGQLKLGKNGGLARLVTKFQVRDQRSISNVVDPLETALYEVPAQYLETVTVTRLNTDAVRSALADEIYLPWAQLERGEHVNGW